MRNSFGNFIFNFIAHGSPHRWMITNLKKSNRITGIKATAILAFLVLFGLVFFIFFVRYGLVELVAAIGVAVAIVGGRKVVKHIIAVGTDQTGRRGDSGTQPNDTIQQAGGGERE